MFAFSLILLLGQPNVLLRKASDIAVNFIENWSKSNSTVFFIFHSPARSVHQFICFCCCFFRVFCLKLISSRTCYFFYCWNQNNKTCSIRSVSFMKQPDGKAILQHRIIKCLVFVCWCVSAKNRNQIWFGCTFNESSLSSLEKRLTKCNDRKKKTRQKSHISENRCVQMHIQR